jgi:hypothetical protein
VRKIKSYFFISLDGVVESPDKWHFSYFDEEMGNLELLSAQTFNSGVLNLSYAAAKD